MPDEFASAYLTRDKARRPGEVQKPRVKSVGESGNSMARGFDRVVNVRFNSAHVSRRFLSAVEMVVYGAGIK